VQRRAAADGDLAMGMAHLDEAQRSHDLQQEPPESTAHRVPR
jgi:hypothetical protein